MIKLLIKLKCKLFAELLVNFLSKEEDILICTELDKLEDAPDVIVTDKFELSPALINKYNNPNILLIDTGLPKEELVSLLIRYKLKGIFLYQSDFSKFKKALKVIYNGQTWISDELVKCLIDKDIFNNVENIKLTDKESEIIKFVCEGLSNKEIASKLFISEQTVKAHLHRIYQKLGVKNRSHLAVIYSKIFSH